jgi:Tfp pilus assembly protein PilN
MTQTTERGVGKQGTGKKAGNSLVVAGALPQVNLLPESIRAVRRLRDARGWFGLAVLVSLVLVAVAWFGGTLLVGQAQDEKTAEEQRTTELLADKAQYAEVTPVLAEMQRVRAGLELASGVEVLWSDYTGAISAVLPEGMQLQTLSTQPVGDGEGAVLPADPLVTPGLYQLTFEARAADAPSAAAMIDQLNSVPGFSDSRVTVVDRQIEGYYSVVGTVQVTQAAASLRFTEETD